MSRRTRALGAAAALGIALVPAAPAQAQVVPGCSDGGTIETRLAEAPVAFTGTVVALQDRGRVATVEVLRVWKGGPLPRRVEVRGTIATQSKVSTALDRVYAEDRLYLFVPSAGASPRFIENQCSATRSFSSELGPVTPAGGGQLPDRSLPGVGLPSPGHVRLLPLAIGAAAFLGIGAFLGRQALRDRARRRSHAHAGRGPQPEMP